MSRIPDWVNKLRQHYVVEKNPTIGGLYFNNTEECCPVGFLLMEHKEILSLDRHISSRIDNVNIMCGLGLTEEEITFLQKLQHDNDWDVDFLDNLEGFLNDTISNYD